MSNYPLKHLPSGHIFIDSGDDCDRVVNAILETDYCEEFCLAADFNEDFIRRLMESGFLVMSMELKENGDEAALPYEPFYILLPKLHLLRSALFFPALHVKKSIRSVLPLYELGVDTCFDLVLKKCIQIHGDDWLTPPLVEALKGIREMKNSRVKPVSFEVYRDGELKAGEIGVVAGHVYTSYSGYREENNAGTAQMILMARWLEKTGFHFIDMGMPLDYKTDLGAKDISPRHFVDLFRAGRQ